MPIMMLPTRFLNSIRINKIRLWLQSLLTIYWEMLAQLQQFIAFLWFELVIVFNSSSKMRNISVIIFGVLCISHAFADTVTIYGYCGTNSINEAGRETFVVPSISAKVLNLIYDFELEVTFWMILFPWPTINAMYLLSYGLGLALRSYCWH